LQWTILRFLVHYARVVRIQLKLNAYIFGELHALMSSRIFDEDPPKLHPATEADDGLKLVRSAPDEATLEELHGAVVAGKYRIEKLLGRGGAGEVFLATHIELDRPVAFKVLRADVAARPEAMERFRREARIAARLHHPNIVAVYDFGSLSERYAFIVMEYLPGKTLRDYLEERKHGLPLREASAFFRQICAGVTAAHQAGYVHRDLKPGNIILEFGDGSEPIVKVLDFGIAKIIENETTETQPDLTGKALLGTPQYCSPEQALGEPVDSRSDIYSLGLVLYVMLTGQLPFTGNTPAALIVQHATKPPRPPRELRPDIPIRLETVILKALSKSPPERPQTAREFSDAVQVAIDEALQYETVPTGQKTDLNAPLPTRVIQSASLVADREADATRMMLTRTHDTGGRDADLRGGRRRLAVLPFRNLAAQAEIDFLSFSLADSIISQMAYVKNLIVRPSSAVERLSSGLTPAEIAEKIDIDTVLTGTFLKSGEKFRVNTQLVDIAPNEILWREQFDVPFGDILILQDHITEKIVAGLNLSLSSDEAKHLHVETPHDMNAYELYMRAKACGRDFAGNEAAVDLLRRSVELDAAYAPAWAELAERYLTLGAGGLGGAQYCVEAGRAARRALDLNPHLISAHFALQATYGQTGRIRQAMESCLTLLEMAPSSEFTHLGLGHLYEFNGELDRALHAFARAQRINSRLITPYTQTAAIYFQRGQDTLAADFLKNDACHDMECDMKAYLLGVLAVRGGDLETAHRHFSASVEIDNKSLWGRLSLSGKMFIDGDATGGLSLLEEVSANAASGDWHFFLAHPFAAAFQRTDLCLNLLNKAVDLGYCNVEALEKDPVFLPLHNHARYASIVERAKAEKAARKPLLDALIAAEERVRQTYAGANTA
jgi:serine/threonine-protein kinase